MCDVLVQGPFRDAHMAADVDEGDAPLCDEPTREADRCAEAVGNLRHAQETFSHGTPFWPEDPALAAMRAAAGE